MDTHCSQLMDIFRRIQFSFASTVFNETFITRTIITICTRQKKKIKQINNNYNICVETVMITDIMLYIIIICTKTVMIYFVLLLYNKYIIRSDETNSRYSDWHNRNDNNRFNTIIMMYIL